jgi:2-polyprenyl-3-methyl-5-hydroxy-6-metoxy-1,4-benzoquinol methylase
MNIKEHYQNVAGGGRVNNEPRLEIVASLVEDNNLKILDIGCYDGEVSYLYKKTTNIVHGADINEEPLKKATEKIDDGFLVDLDQKWESITSDEYDIVIMSAVLEHVFDYKNVFTEIKRVLKNNGSFIHATPNATSLRSRIELLNGDVPAWFKNFEHIRMWTRKYLNTTLKQYGFRESHFTGCFVSDSKLGKVYSMFFPNTSPIFIQKFILKNDVAANIEIK